MQKCTKCKRALREDVEVYAVGSDKCVNCLVAETPAGTQKLTPDVKICIPMPLCGGNDRVGGPPCIVCKEPLPEVTGGKDPHPVNDPKWHMSCRGCKASPKHICCYLKNWTAAEYTLTWNGTDKTNLFLERAKCPICGKEEYTDPKDGTHKKVAWKVSVGSIPFPRGVFLYRNDTCTEIVLPCNKMRPMGM